MASRDYDGFGRQSYRVTFEDGRQATVDEFSADSALGYVRRRLPHAERSYVALIERYEDGAWRVAQRGDYRDRRAWVG